MTPGNTKGSITTDCIWRCARGKYAAIMKTDGVINAVPNNTAAKETVNERPSALRKRASDSRPAYHFKVNPSGNSEFCHEMATEYNNVAITGSSKNAMKAAAVM